ncbi:MAG TPA: carbohydrate ABC transporter permease [bacterium]|jgi:multiple sugar transport system permease protein|nr:carbohydrate ABC transporter permease [Dictyoglomota bacterium]HOP55289.1 carbohydrate ABC transporter permease [bacterium]HPO81734.1 carbohydrate ABC transporter permease [bacterium]HRR91836.1 carbohydrate ABC transporter permease [bacterium]
MAKRAKRQNIIYHIATFILGIIMIYPLLWMISSSFKENADIFTTMGTLIPPKFTVENYIEGWKGFGNVSFATFFKNSFIVAGIGTIGTVISSAIVAYGFARIPFKGKDLWFTAMMITLMLPFQVQIIPQYIMFNTLNWINTFYPLIVPKFFGSAFFIFLIIQFIRGLPLELDESAEIDGAGRIGIFWWIILPLIKPALITASLFSFYWTWDDFLGPLLYLNQATLYTVSLALKNFADPTTITNWGAVFAMSVLSLMPVLLIFIFFQKYLTEGIATTGMKG